MKLFKKYVIAFLCVATSVLYSGCSSLILQNKIFEENNSTLESTYAPVPENSKLEVCFIDVGQADSTLIQCNNEVMLIDGGNVADSDVIATVLNKNDISYIDYVVCTHAHEDHVGGLSGALSVAEAGRVFAPKTTADTKAYENFERKVEEQGKSIETPEIGEKFMLGDAQVEILGPVNETGKNTNSTSIVLRIDFGNTSFLFTGDAERDEEEEIIETGSNLKATVLKVGHHGSDTSTSYPFLREVMPQYAVISCGKNNSYGHPNESVLSRLLDSGANVLRTDEIGDIKMESDGEEVKIIS